MQRPTPPRALTEKEITSPTEPWQLKREEMVAFLDPERAPKWNNSDALLAEKQQNLLKPTVDISRSSACPPSEVSSHFLPSGFLVVVRVMVLRCCYCFRDNILA